MQFKKTKKRGDIIMEYVFLWIVSFSIFQIFVFCAGEVSFPRKENDEKSEKFSVKLKSFVEDLTRDIKWFFKSHEECPECGCREHTVEVFPDIPHTLWWDSSYIPPIMKKCKNCGTVF